MRADRALHMSSELAAQLQSAQVPEQLPEAPVASGSLHRLLEAAHRVFDPSGAPMAHRLDDKAARPAHLYEPRRRLERRGDVASFELLVREGL